MEIPRAGQELPEQRGAIDEAMGDQVADALLVLHLAVHLQQARFEQRCALLLPDAFPDDDVHLPALILEREESDATGGRRALAHEHDAGGAHPGAVGRRLQLAGALKRRGAQPPAQQRERMASECEPEGGVVGDDALTFGRCPQQRPPLRGSGAVLSSEPQGERALGAGHLPEGQVPVAAQGGKGTGGGQRLEIAALERAAYA